MTFAVGDAVRWTSSCTRKEGVVVAIVPAGYKPDTKLVKTDGIHRREESYVVKGGEPGRRQAHYWPLVSLLERRDGLNSEELAWCHNNAPRIRALMSSQDPNHA